MHAFAAILFGLVGHAAATYGTPAPAPAPAPASPPISPMILPPPAINKLCCPNGAGKNICSDGKGKKFDATCCAGGEWKCPQRGVYTDVCVGLGDGAECPALPPAVKPKCCKPTSKPKMCPGAGYGSKKVPALCCANGKYRCGSCDDFGGESKKCKCCNPAKIATQVDCGMGRPVCCNDGRWRCGSSASIVCKPFLGKGKKCTRPVPPPPTPAPKPSACCNRNIKIKLPCDFTGRYGSSLPPALCCKDGSWNCNSCSKNGGSGTVCPSGPSTCCNPDVKLACVPTTGSYGGSAAPQPKCCKDGSWSCAGCGANNGNGIVCPRPAPPAPSPCCNPGAKIACTASSYGTVLPPKCCKDGAWSCTGCSANGGNGNECSTGSGYTS